MIPSRFICFSSPSIIQSSIGGRRKSLQPSFLQGRLCTACRRVYLTSLTIQYVYGLKSGTKTIIDDNRWDSMRTYLKIVSILDNYLSKFSFFSPCLSNIMAVSFFLSLHRLIAQEMHRPCGSPVSNHHCKGHTNYHSSSSIHPFSTCLWSRMSFPFFFMPWIEC